jgi:hypothetical protein
MRAEARRRAAAHQQPAGGGTRSARPAARGEARGRSELACRSRARPQRAAPAPSACAASRLREPHSDPGARHLRCAALDSAACSDRLCLPRTPHAAAAAPAAAGRRQGHAHARQGRCRTAGICARSAGRAAAAGPRPQGGGGVEDGLTGSKRQSRWVGRLMKGPPPAWHFTTDLESVWLLSTPVTARTPTHRAPPRSTALHPQDAPIVLGSDSDGDGGDAAPAAGAGHGRSRPPAALLQLPSQRFAVGGRGPISFAVTPRLQLVGCGHALRGCASWGSALRSTQCGLTEKGPGRRAPPVCRLPHAPHPTAGRAHCELQRVGS